MRITWLGNTGDFRIRGRVGPGQKAAIAAQAAVFSLWLRVLNVCSRQPLTGQSNADVSLTSYGRRIRSVWSTVESIGRGAARPRRLILWLDDEAAVLNPPPHLKRLVKRGLEIRPCADFGPHKKYFPYLLDGQPSRTLVTADDDVYYPKSWLKDLLDQHRGGEVTAYRARIREDAPYAIWRMCDNDQASERVFATGVSGVAYPPILLEILRSRGDEFMRVCPKADDFWLHFAAVGSGVPIRQVGSRPADWWPHLRSGGTALWHRNLSQGNDEIAARTATAWLGRG